MSSTITPLSLEQTQSLDIFVCRTRLTETESLYFLDDCDWDLAVALKKFELEGASLSQSSACVDHHDDPMKPSTSQDKVSLCSSDCGRQNQMMPGYAFCLPDLGCLAPDFRTFLEKDLIESPTQRRLENSKHLNWWSQFGQKLYPLSTTGDGNCLLHAASLGMWGLHDRQLTLRQALYEMIIRGSRRSALWRRWKWSEHKSYLAIGLTLSEDEWVNEWNNNIVALASPVPRKTDDSSSDSTDQIYESLEAIHVFALAHVLKRPIIVVSDTVLRNAKGEELSPVPFGGVYLPLECSPEQCHRSPLVLCYDSAHFSPLVPMRHDSSQPQIIPITDANRNLLPIHFATDPGPDFTWWSSKEDDRHASRLEMKDSDRLALMSEYMDLVRLDVRRGSVRRTRPIRSATPPTHSAEKSMTLGTSGVPSDSRDKKRILNEIRQQVMRTLRITGSKNKENGIDARLCAADLSRSSCVIAGLLVQSSHEYMEDMVREYMKTARERFQNNGSESSGGGRKRISRSFSASSLRIFCISQHCDKPASQSSNFLCRDCFEHQKELMTSFNCSASPSSMRNSSKSNTMPAIASSTNIPSVAVPSTLPSDRALVSRSTQSPAAVVPSSPSPLETVSSATKITAPSSSSPRQSRVGLTVSSPSTPSHHSLGSRATDVPVLGVVTKGHVTTTQMSKVEGENGVTHYYVSGEEPQEVLSASSSSLVPASPSRATAYCAASHHGSPSRPSSGAVLRATTLSQLAAS